MSKSLRNYPDVNEVFHRDGSDAMRWFLMASPILRGGNLMVTEEGIREGVRQVMLPLWSTYYFFTLVRGRRQRGSGRSRQGDGRRQGGLAPRHGSLRARQDRGAGADGHRADGGVRRPRRERVARSVHGPAHQLVRAHAARPLLGRGRRRLRHPLHGARDGDAPGSAPAAARDRGDLARAHRRALRAPDRLPRGPRGVG